MAVDPNTASAPPRGRGSFFGRRKGKTLRAHHSELLGHDLPQLELDLSGPFDPTASFRNPVTDRRRIAVRRLRGVFDLRQLLARGIRLALAVPHAGIEAAGGKQ